MIKAGWPESDISGMSSLLVLESLRRMLTGRPRPGVVLPDDARPSGTRSTSPTYVNLVAPLPAPAPRRHVEFEVYEQA